VIANAITVEAALEALLDLVSPMPSEIIPLIEAAGRVLAQDVTAKRAQPPFAASAMDSKRAKPFVSSPALRSLKGPHGSSFRRTSRAART